MKTLISLGLATCTIFLFHGKASAQVAGSTNYSFTYAVAAASGQPSFSSSYSTVGLVRTGGAVAQASSSASYSLKPVIGSSPSSPAAGIGDWQLY